MNTYANEQRFTRFFHYIQNHLQQGLDLQRVADAVYVSPWHWHRLYQDIMGETQHATLKWMRLHRAAWLLTYSDKTIAEIARECGYGGNTQSFARTFRAAYGLTPHNYRRQHLPRDYPVQIVELSSIPLIAMDHFGDYQRMGDTFVHLQSLLHIRGQMPDNSRVFSLQYKDPTITPIHELHSRIAIMGAPRHLDPPLLAEQIVAGRYALLHHHGALANINRAFHWLCKTWLPENSYSKQEELPSIIEFSADPRATPASAQYAKLYTPIA